MDAANKINFVPDWTAKYAETVPIPERELMQLVETCKRFENQTGKRYFIVPGFKAFGPDLNCRDFQYEEGQLYVYSDPEDVMICNSGFHFCPNIADVFDYYPMSLCTPVALVFGIVSDDYESGFYEFKSADPSCDDRKLRIDKLCGAAIYVSKILTHEEIIEGICKTLNIDKDLEFTITAILSLCGCKTDLNYYRGSKGDTAYIRLPNGEVVEVSNVTYDYHRGNDLIVVRLIDGTEYFTHASNVCIVSKTEEE